MVCVCIIYKLNSIQSKIFFQSAICCNTNPSSYHPNNLLVVCLFFEAVVMFFWWIQHSVAKWCSIRAVV